MCCYHFIESMCLTLTRHFCFHLHTRFSLKCDLNVNDSYQITCPIIFGQARYISEVNPNIKVFIHFFYNHFKIDR